MTNGDDSSDSRGGVRAAAGWFLRTDNGVVMFVREAGSSALAVGMVGLLLFAVSGVWPPLVAVESGSMQPNMEKGDLVFVMEEQRFSPDYATGETGVVTARTGAEQNFRKFGGPGDVIVYQPNGNSRQTPVIHRVRFWVDDGENWYQKADDRFVAGADNCEELRNCPAPHAGFITKGDNAATNDYYDQAKGISEPVRPSWIKGTAEYRIPYLGWVRLTVSGTASIQPATATANGTVNATAGPAAASPATAA